MSEKERLQLENELLMTCSKAQAINKYIDELEESSKLSELWCKSQQENKQLKENYKLIDKSMSELIEENQQLKQKYLNAVADYESEKSKNQIAIEYINNFDVFKEFSFPLMKRDIENQIKSSIDYEFKTSLLKELLEKLKGDNNE